MISCRTKQWGNSIGIIIPKEELNKRNIKEDQEIVITIEKKENPLKELFGFGKGKKLTQGSIKESRKLMESKY